MTPNAARAALAAALAAPLSLDRAEKIAAANDALAAALGPPPPVLAIQAPLPGSPAIYLGADRAWWVKGQPIPYTTEAEAQAAANASLKAQPRPAAQTQVQRDICSVCGIEICYGTVCEDCADDAQYGADNLDHDALPAHGYELTAANLKTEIEGAIVAAEWKVREHVSRSEYGNGWSLYAIVDGVRIRISNHLSMSSRSDQNEVQVYIHGNKWQLTDSEHKIKHEISPNAIAIMAAMNARLIVKRWRYELSAAYSWERTRR